MEPFYNLSLLSGFQQHIAGFALVPFESQTAFHRFKNCMIDAVLCG